MNTDEVRKKLISETLDVVGSFQRASEKAGGRVDLHSLLTMSVIELIQLMAPNNIRFTYQGKEDATTSRL
jgi:hypothetical protein